MFHVKHFFVSLGEDYFLSRNVVEKKEWLKVLKENKKIKSKLEK